MLKKKAREKMWKRFNREMTFFREAFQSESLQKRREKKDDSRESQTSLYAAA